MREVMQPIFWLCVRFNLILFVEEENDSEEERHSDDSDEGVAVDETVCPEGQQASFYLFQSHSNKL